MGKDSWRKNPRLIEFYKMSRLSQVASDLEDYDRDDAARDSWRKGRPVPSFDGKDFGFITVAARNRAELKKKLMDAARSFLPDPELRSPAMDDFSASAEKDGCLDSAPDICLSAGRIFMTAASIPAMTARFPGMMTSKPAFRRCLTQDGNLNFRARSGVQEAAEMQKARNRKHKVDRDNDIGYE